MTKINLSAETVLSTGYLGRGTPSKWVRLAAGSEVEYSRRDRDAGAAYLPFVETAHTVSVKGDDGLTYSATRTTYALRFAFDPATYYGGAIQRLPDGAWNFATAGGAYAADDGFGNLVPVDQLPPSHPNHYSSVKAIDDCVVGRHYWIPGSRA